MFYTHPPSISLHIYFLLSNYSPVTIEEKWPQIESEPKIQISFERSDVLKKGLNRNLVRPIVVELSNKIATTFQASFNRTLASQKFHTLQLSRNFENM